MVYKNTFPMLFLLRYVAVLTLVWMLASCGADAPEKAAPSSEPPVVADTPVDTTLAGNMDDTYENTDRVAWQRPNLIIGLLGNGDLSGKVVADIGTGAGFFAKRLTPLASKVIALDIDEKFLRLIDSTKVLELSPNIQDRLETRLTPKDRPNLGPEEVDAILIVNTFMYIQNQAEYLQLLKPCLKAGGRLVIVDFKRKRTDIGPLPRERRTPIFVVEDLLYEAGYRNIRAIDTELNYQYILVAER